MDLKLVFLLIKTSEDFVESIVNEIELLCQKFVQFFTTLLKQRHIVCRKPSRVHHHLWEVRNILLNSFRYKKMSQKFTYTCQAHSWADDHYVNQTYSPHRPQCYKPCRSRRPVCLDASGNQPCAPATHSALTCLILHYLECLAEKVACSSL
jgi:hypothetical protein